MRNAVTNECANIIKSSLIHYEATEEKLRDELLNKNN